TEEDQPMADTPRTLREALEAALAEDPDDVATHAAYADLLTEQGDPRGEFIQVQLALEDESRPAKERRELQQRERDLLHAHARTADGLPVPGQRARLRVRHTPGRRPAPLTRRPARRLCGRRRPAPAAPGRAVPVRHRPRHGSAVHLDRPAAAARPGGLPRRP